MEEGGGRDWKVEGEGEGERRKREKGGAIRKKYGGRWGREWKVEGVGEGERKEREKGRKVEERRGMIERNEGEKDDLLD